MREAVEVYHYVSVVCSSTVDWYDIDIQTLFCWCT